MWVSEMGVSENKEFFYYLRDAGNMYFLNRKKVKK